MIASERRALARAVGGATVEVAAVVEQAQVTILRKCLRALGLAGTPVEAAARVHVTGVHFAIAGIAKISALAAGAILFRTTPPGAQPISDSKRTATVQSAVTSFLSDALTRDLRPLAPAMSVRADGRPVRLTQDSLAGAFPDPSGRVAVFLHGLSATEHVWGGVDSYGERLRAETGTTPIFVRYDSGAHVAESGERFAHLLEHLTAHWPTEIRSVVLVGHSMGGLIIQSACDHGRDAGHGWARRVDAAFYLGAPNHGAPLERGIVKAAEMLAGRPSTSVFARVLEWRSRGIKDMRDRHDVPLHCGAAHHFVASALLPRSFGVVADAVGDGMIPVHSADGSTLPGRLGTPPAVHRHYLQGVRHNKLVNCDEVYSVLSAALRDSTE